VTTIAVRDSGETARQLLKEYDNHYLKDGACPGKEMPLLKRKCHYENG